MTDNSSMGIKLTDSSTSSDGGHDGSPFTDPHCFGMSELPNASSERARVSNIITLRRQRRNDSEPIVNKSSSSSPIKTETDVTLSDHEFESSPLFKHLAHGLAYTTGSALGASPPSLEACLAAYQVSNRAGLTAGSRAWSKHCHRSSSQSQSQHHQPEPECHIIPASDTTEADADKANEKTSRTKKKKNEGWWGTASGPIYVINENSLALFWKVMNGATWKNLHWLPHQILVYEVRLPEGYGMRWARDLSGCDIIGMSLAGANLNEVAHHDNRPWIFRGFLEPQMENGHELGWRHTI